MGIFFAKPSYPDQIKPRNSIFTHKKTTLNLLKNNEKTNQYIKTYYIITNSILKISFFIIKKREYIKWFADIKTI